MPAVLLFVILVRFRPWVNLPCSDPRTESDLRGRNGPSGLS